MSSASFAIRPRPSPTSGSGRVRGATDSSRPRSGVKGAGPGRGGVTAGKKPGGAAATSAAASQRTRAAAGCLSPTLNQQDLAATGRSLHIPVYKPTQHVPELNKPDVLRRLASGDLLVNQSHDEQLELRPMHIKCSCGDIKAKSANARTRRPSSPSASSSDASSGSDSDGDSDDSRDVGYSVANLIKLLIVHERKGGQPSKGNVLRNLAASVSVDDSVTEIQLQKLLRLVTSPVAGVRQASLLALQRAGGSPHHASLLLQAGAVSSTLLLLHGEQDCTVAAEGCHLLKEITNHTELKDLWLEEMIVTGLTILIGLLSDEGRGQGMATSSQLRQAAAGLLSHLANHLQLGVMMLDHCMGDIEQAFYKHTDIRHQVTELLTNLVSHNDHTAGAVLNHKFTSLVAVILRDGPCSVQTQAMSFCRRLCQYAAGVQALIREEMLLTSFLQVLRSTHCREVRRLGISTQARILRESSTQQLRVFFRQAERAFGGGRGQVNVDPLRQRASDLWTPLTMETMETGERDGEQEEMKKKMKLGVKHVLDLVMHVISIEGKLQTDEAGKVSDVRFRPGQDAYHALAEAVGCLRALANMSEAVLSRPAVHRLLVSDGALHTVDLLHTYTIARYGHSLSATPDPARQQRNQEALYLQASMKLWEGGGESGAGLVEGVGMGGEQYADSEMEFVGSLLEFLWVLADASSESWNQGVVGNLEEQVKKSSDWVAEESLDDDDRDLQMTNGEYKVIGHVGQAFHEEGAHQVTNRKRRPKVTFAWGDNEKGQSGIRKADVNHNDVSIPKHRAQGMQHHPNSNANKGMRKEPWRLRNLVEGGNNNVSDCGDAGENSDSLEMTQKKQAAQRGLKRALFRSGVCETVSAWMVCTHHHIEELACRLVRCLTQPQDPEEIHRFAAEASRTMNPAQRHQARAQEMADSLAERDALLSKILSQMSMDTASLVADTVGVKGQGKGKGQDKSKDEKKSKAAAAADDDGLARTTTSKTSKTKLGKKRPLSSYKPSLSTEQPLAYQGSLLVLDLCGKRLVKSLGGGAGGGGRRGQLLVLYDLVSFGDLLIHMTLASQGIVSYLMQYIKTDIRNSVDILLCLTMLRSLTGDRRIKQLFRSEGGEKFLQRLASQTKGAVRLHAQRFLSSLSQGTTGLVWT